MEARNRGLPDWMTRIRTRQLVLPRFQRMEAWGYREVTDLLQTVIRGLPAGAVLVLEVGDEVPFVWRSLETAPEKGDRVAELLLDGQQRLTALWRSLNNTYRDRTYFVELPPENEPEDGIQIVPEGRWERNGRRYPIWADDPAQCWSRRLIPVHLLCPGNEAETEMDQWVVKAVGGDLACDKQLTRQIDRLRQRVATFNLPFLSLPVGSPRDIVLDVFVKMNTRSVRLTAFDIIVAQTEAEAGESLHDLARGLAASVPGLPAYDDPEDIVLNAMALMQDRVPNQTGYLGLDFRRMVEEWPIMVEGARVTVEFLEQEMILDASRLPTESVLAPLIALWAKVPYHPDVRGNARILLRKYLWCSFFTDRYERAAATAALQDFRALRGVLAGKEKESSVPCFDLSQHPLPTIGALLQAGWPKRRDRLARAVLLLSLRGGALDLADGQTATRTHLGRREYHHLFPVGFLRSQGVDDSEAYKSLNCALISWRTNRAISAKEPIQYLLERAEASTLGEAEVRHRLATHFIPYDTLAIGDYEAFLEERATLAREAVEVLCKGVSWIPDWVSK